MSISAMHVTASTLLCVAGVVFIWIGSAQSDMHQAIPGLLMIAAGAMQAYVAGATQGDTR